MKKRKKPKTWAGNRPSIRDGWRLADFVRCDGAEWEIYLRQSFDRSGWIGIKLVACGRVEMKANYWIGWSFDELRFSEVDDLSKLQTNCPDLFRHVQNLVESHAA